MVELSLFSDWAYCSACGLPATTEDDTNNYNDKPKKKKLMACADCGCVAYHNSTCQKSHWKTCHKRDCKELARVILPLKELIRWHRMNKRVKKNNRDARALSDGRRRESGIESITFCCTDDDDDDDDDVQAGDGKNEGKRLWCWWEPDNENGITPETLSISNTLWERSEQQWNNEDYLTAMKGFQTSLEIYKSAWPYIGKSSGSNDRVKDSDVNDFCDKSFKLAKKLLFCAYCELDANQVDSARQRLVQCISIIMTIFSRTLSKDNVKDVLNDAWMELMLSYEEVPRHRVIARHVATLAMATKSCGWSDPFQRPGYMVRGGPPAVPYIPPDKHPAWCRVLEQNWIRILNEYNKIIENPLNLSNVGSGQRGSGHNDHSVVAGRSWKEYVLFGTGSKDDDSDCPYTKNLLRTHVPDAVSLAEKGGGEVIFSRLAPRTRIESHCGPTNLRLTAHLGLVIPDSESNSQIRVRDKWYSWFPGKILLFDDSFEHEVKNDTDETRVVLLIRLWRPDVNSSCAKRAEILEDARIKKGEAVQKRYNCSALMKL